MQSFNYVIKDELGIHARPAGLLVKEAKKFDSNIRIKKGDNEINATQLFKLMGLGIKNGDQIEVITEGEDELIANKALQKFFQENL